MDEEATLLRIPFDCVCTNIANKIILGTLLYSQGHGIRHQFVDGSGDWTVSQQQSNGQPTFILARHFSPSYDSHSIVPSLRTVSLHHYAAMSDAAFRRDSGLHGPSSAVG